MYHHIKVQEFKLLFLRMHFCVLYESENKEPLLVYIPLTF